MPIQGEVLREARKKKGLSVAVLAVRVNSSPSTIERTEQGTTIPMADLFLDLCAELEVDPRECRAKNVP